MNTGRAWKDSIRLAGQGALNGVAVVGTILVCMTVLFSVLWLVATLFREASDDEKFYALFITGMLVYGALIGAAVNVLSGRAMKGGTDAK